MAKRGQILAARIIDLVSLPLWVSGVVLCFVAGGFSAGVALFSVAMTLNIIASWVREPSQPRE